MSKSTLGEVSRRSFVKTAAGLGAFAALGVTGCSASFHEEEPATEEEVEVEAEEHETWAHCSPNCYGRCALRVVTQNDEVVRVETDNTGDDVFGDHQIRACLRGRSMRRWINHPDRLQYPMKRVGKRGSGEYERITWEEAIDTICEKYQSILDEYGPEAVLIAPASGVKAQNISDFVGRFCNCLGGYVHQSGGYSMAQARVSVPYLYGDRKNNATYDLKNSKLCVMFGDNHADNKLGGAGDCYQIQQALEAGGAKVIVIDPRYTATSALRADQWIPIRPGTDAALADAIAYVLITEDMVDQDFLDTYCIGYDESTLPESAPAKSDYKSHILGEGPDGTAKTPAWASEITGIPEQVISDLAHEIGTTQPCCIMQGLGPQRQMSGEQTCRAICMLEVLLGGIGKRGMGTGFMFGNDKIDGVEVPMGKGTFNITIPTFMYMDAIDDYTKITLLDSGLTGAGRLRQPIKMMFSHGGNSLTNQHGNINRSHEILGDESKCEMIVVWETMLTDSAKYADIILPDLMPSEQPSFAVGEYSGNMGYAILGTACTEPKFERKTLYQSLTLMAEKMGVAEKFTEGLDEMGWLEQMYATAREEDPDLPEWEDMLEMGVYRRLHKDGADGGSIAYKKFIDNPGKESLKTPSGKIEIYSERLAKIADTWHLGENDVIMPIPVYVPPAEYGYDDPRRDEYPLQMVGFHERGHAHSSFTQIDILQATNMKRFWINTADAEERGIADDDMVEVFNEFGRMQVQAKVTDRIMPGVTAMGQGYWFEANEDGVDVGGCINTLTNSHPSPLAKAIPAHTNLVEVKKVM
ncbi:DMSO/selenate family reductase complex A subunit [Slackia heliotrinireducens]|uniref:Anaerobic dimethyl sulfoxide reductase, A subunit, DmsA/YnfE family n=1 Tax=Slackia heliotrinireducens (strain ATCC 29202 / DSM 20476 / NCTC 11029 / RHS 1) TaxID=471855 RepID=C7N2X1_SLAHD|nr:DMSO/selenate family reductase complex A subunit [Slackia heliotrinireducens]ACV21492.1 anaerobic dimethyl sulfoxide reductase, A subunit, DmsA/YnfE family [Slackia heliotrinireducens DSM 20476]VEG98931.1 Dimethyl sulfoxide reductase DmsA precursor [Slackia heliotrinireducens]